MGFCCQRSGQKKELSPPGLIQFEVLPAWRISNGPCKWESLQSLRGIQVFLTTLQPTLSPSIMWEDVFFFSPSLSNRFVEKNNICSHCEQNIFQVCHFLRLGIPILKNPKDDFQALLHDMLGSCPPPCTNEAHFQAVDGAIGRVCRGLTPEDNANTYFTVRIANSTDQCKQLCRDYPGCKGVEGKFEMKSRKWSVKNDKDASVSSKWCKLWKCSVYLSYRQCILIYVEMYA